VSTLLPLAFYLVGLAVGALGGSLFLRGAVDLARWLRVPPGIIGVTVAAVATSSPELAVALTAARRGQPELSLGVALGSNVVNAGLVLGLALLSAPMKVAAGATRDRVAAFAAPLLTAAFLVDGRLTRLEAGVLVAAFAVWLVAVIRDARRPLEELPIEETVQPVTVVFTLLGGVAALVGAGHLVVAGARGLGGALGLSAFVMGASLVALGVGVPRLVATVVAARRGHDDVGAGAVLGSCLFNGLFVVGASGLVLPVRVAWREVAISVAFGVLTAALMTPGADGALTRRRGVALVLAYVAYLAVALSAGYG